MNFEKLTDRSKGFFQSAQSLALREGHQQFAPEQVGVAAQVDQRREPRGPQGDADRALAPGPPKAVADNDGNIGAESLREVSPQPLG